MKPVGIICNPASGKDLRRLWAHSAHVTLRRGERSRLADFASEVL